MAAAPHTIERTHCDPKSGRIVVGKIEPPPYRLIVGQLWVLIGLGIATSLLALVRASGTQSKRAGARQLQTDAADFYHKHKGAMTSGAELSNANYDPAATPRAGAKELQSR